ncbi:hypothetical protein KY335_03475 [Candidatus Woesearchaeota archaeon]|nr:hypothetical protein [Candidatus Woesearchaeota archaeon]
MDSSLEYLQNMETSGTQGPPENSLSPVKKTREREVEISDPTFEDIAYRQFGILRRIGYCFTDRIGITGDLKRARRYYENLVAKEDQMNKAINNYFDERRAIEKSISDLTVGNIEAEKEIRGLEDDVKRLRGEVTSLEIEVDGLEGKEDEFDIYTEKKRALIGKKDELETRRFEITKREKERDERSQEIKREEKRLTTYKESTDRLVEERGDLGRYISTINDVIVDEENRRQIPFVKKIRGA